MENEKQITSSLDATRRGRLNNFKEELNPRKMFAPLWDLQTACVTLSRRLTDNMQVQSHLLQGPLMSPCTRHNAIENVYTVQNSQLYRNVETSWTVNSKICNFTDFMNVEHGSKVFCENSEKQTRKCALLHAKLTKPSHFLYT